MYNPDGLFGVYEYSNGTTIYITAHSEQEYQQEKDSVIIPDNLDWVSFSTFVTADTHNEMLDKLDLFKKLYVCVDLRIITIDDDGNETIEHETYDFEYCENIDDDEEN
jgi:hypothetical protein